MIDEQIIARAQSKYISAFEEIYRVMLDFVWNVSLKTAGREDLAEDIAAEVFIKVFLKIKQFSFRSSFSSWVYRITVNTAINTLKREKKKQSLEIIENLDYLPDDTADDQTEYIEKLLGRLSPKQKMIIILKDIQGLSYKEISESLGLSLSSVKINLFRARERLREIVEMEVKNDEKLSKTGNR